MKPEALRLELDALENIRDTLAARIERGLREDDTEIRALPAFLRPPHPGAHGRVLAFDAGGTNLRAAVVALDADGHARIVSGPEQAILPDGRGGHRVTRAQFYAAHVALAQKLDGAHGLPVGYCFSYPSLSERNGDARLIRWTKGVFVDGVEGTRVGEGLIAALTEAGLEPGRVVVLNDTVASLLGAAGQDVQPARAIGLIVGTGHNLAGYFDGARVTKLDVPWSGPLAVNLESGNYAPPHLTALDDTLDAASEDPGRQRLEKAVSGYYLPQLFRGARPQRSDISDGQGFTQLAGNPSDADAPFARALLDRSAELVAAAISAVAGLYPADPQGPIVVLAEGGLFHSTPRYAARVSATIERLRGPSPIRIARTADANLVGAAWAALS